MIQGLNVDVSSEEMKSLLLARLKHHQDKLALYEQQRGEIETVEKTLASEAREHSKFSHGSPMQAIDEAIKKHRSQIIYYKFTSEHVVPNDVYRLAELDLIRLGIQSERY